MSDFNTSFRVGDAVVGPPAVGLNGAVWWIPEPSGFDSLCRINGPVGRFLKERAQETQHLAKALAPVDTGELRDSIYILYGKHETGIWAEIGTDVFYAPFQEFGTVNHDAHPFLRPALQATMESTFSRGLYGGYTEDVATDFFPTDDRFAWDSETRGWFEV